MAGFRFIRRQGGGDPPLKPYTADTDTTLAVGDLVKIGSDGYLDIAATTNAILGVAENAVTATSGTRPTVMVTLATADAVFQAETTGDAQQTVVGAQCTLDGATGAQTVDEDDSTSDNMRIIGFKKGESAGTGATVEVVITKRQFDGTSD